MIFLFCLGSLVCGVPSSGAGLARTMYDSEEETEHVVFLYSFCCDTKKDFIIQSISYVNIIHQWVTERLLHEASVQAMNSSEVKASKSTVYWN